MAFVERHGLTVSPFQLRFYVSRLDTTKSFTALSAVQGWSTRNNLARFMAAWFSIGATVGLLCFILTPIYLTWLLLNEVGNWISLLNWLGTGSTYSMITRLTRDGRYDFSSLAPPENSISYVPYQHHVQSGITPVIPGVNIPWSHLPLFMFVLVIAGAVHELGHAVAALSANVRLNGFGVFLFAVYPGAFTEIETDELNRSSCAQKMRIFCAGIWHNLVLAFIGILLLWALPYVLMPMYATGSGVVVTEVSPASGLVGSTGLLPGSTITRINHCPVHNISDWTKCLQKHRVTSARSGYLVHKYQVLPMTATPSKVSTVGGETQCCEEFENVTLASHICFRYENGFTLADAAVAVSPSNTTPALLAESLGIKSRIKRANIKPAAPPPRDGSAAGNATTQSTPTHTQVDGVSPAPPPTAVARTHRFAHACLPARQVTTQPPCDTKDTTSKRRAQKGMLCVVPALYNGTVLLRFAVNNSKDVLFIGSLSEPLTMVSVVNFVSRSTWIPYYYPSAVELFAKYLITFSLAMGLLNAVPCYALDGQFMCNTIVDYFFHRHSNM
ncbi:Protein Y56A3A.2 [Aphelenchoides avenae]|nr:Protein Y56A3A.2 [Aphelenchus avenae]